MIDELAEIKRRHALQGTHGSKNQEYRDIDWLLRELCRSQSGRQSSLQLGDMTCNTKRGGKLRMVANTTDVISPTPEEMAHIDLDDPAWPPCCDGGFGPCGTCG